MRSPRFKIFGSLKTLTLADLRSTTGLVIGLYVTMHLSNHALGLFSLQAQEAVRPWVMALWHSLPGQVLLYGSLSAHAIVALVAIMRRRHYRMPTWEATQILVGLSVETLRAAKVSVPIPLKEVSLRGRSMTMAVAALDAKTLRQLLSSAPAKRTEHEGPHLSDNGKRDRI